MSITVLNDTMPKARRSYPCDASRYVLEYVNEGMFTIDEYRYIIRAKRNGYMIQPGQKYVKQVAVWNGDFGVFRAIPEMHDIAWKYDLYPDD